MTVDPTNQPPTPRHRLRTFGTLALAGAEDAVLDSQGSQRRRLALLAVLAAAGDKGRSRDQLLLLFWPDATQARARHSLEQLLYAIRSSLGKDVFGGVNPLRLNTSAIGSDVSDFLGSIELGDFETAVEQYRGPFLDGFYLGDAPEFEQWIAAERERLARSHADALERLAGIASADGDHAAAVRWFRKLTEADPLSSAHAIGLMRALVSAGDHAAALQHAERHEALVSKELGASAGPAVAKLVAEIRAKSKAGSVTPARTLVLPPAPTAPSPPPPAVELTSAVDDRTEKSRPAEPPVPTRARRGRLAPYLFGTAAILAAVAVSIGARSLLREKPEPVLSTGSIAVLPFVNVGGNEQDVPIVDGLTEEMIAVLAKIPNLRVISRTSVFAFKDSDAGARRIADSLGVANVLEGSVQRSGTRLRVQVRLVDARDGATRWSRTYDRELSDVFAVQSEIAGAVAQALDLHLGASSVARIKQGSTANIAAYELYLRGTDRTLLRSDSAGLLGLDYLLQAVALDSTYAAAWAGLARMYNVTASAVPSAQRSRHYALALASARKAVALDDSLADGHVTLGVLRAAQFDFAGAERHLSRAVALDPTSPLPHELMVSLALWRERPDEALAHAQRALEIDPLSPYAHAELARALIGNDRCDEALAYLAKIANLRPPLRRAAVLTMLCQARKGMWPQAIATIRPQADREVQATGWLGYLLARSGNRPGALEVEGALRARVARGESVGFNLALVQAGLGNHEEAVAWLERAIETSRSNGLGNPMAVGIMMPLFEDLHRHPSFARIRERMGLQKR